MENDDTVTLLFRRLVDSQNVIGRLEAQNEVLKLKVKLTSQQLQDIETNTNTNGLELPDSRIRSRQAKAPDTDPVDSQVRTPQSDAHLSSLATPKEDELSTALLNLKAGFKRREATLREQLEQHKEAVYALYASHSKMRSHLKDICSALCKQLDGVERLGLCQGEHSENLTCREEEILSLQMKLVEAFRLLKAAKSEYEAAAEPPLEAGSEAQGRAEDGEDEEYEEGKGEIGSAAWDAEEDDMDGSRDDAEGEEEDAPLDDERAHPLVESDQEEEREEDPSPPCSTMSSPDHLAQLGLQSTSTASLCMLDTAPRPAPFEEDASPTIEPPQAPRSVSPHSPPAHSHDAHAASTVGAVVTLEDSPSPGLAQSTLFSGVDESKAFASAHSHIALPSTALPSMRRTRSSDQHSSNLHADDPLFPSRGSAVVTRDSELSHDSIDEDIFVSKHIYQVDTAIEPHSRITQPSSSLPAAESDQLLAPIHVVDDHTEDAELSNIYHNLVTGLQSQESAHSVETSPLTLDDMSLPGQTDDASPSQQHGDAESENEEEEEEEEKADRERRAVLQELLGHETSPEPIEADRTGQTAHPPSSSHPTFSSPPAMAHRDERALPQNGMSKEKTTATSHPPHREEEEAAKFSPRASAPIDRALSPTTASIVSEYQAERERLLQRDEAYAREMETVQCILGEKLFLLQTEHRREMDRLLREQERSHQGHSSNAEGSALPRHLRYDSNGDHPASGEREEQQPATQPAVSAADEVRDWDRLFLPEGEGEGESLPNLSTSAVSSVQRHVAETQLDIAQEHIVNLTQTKEKLEREIKEMRLAFEGQNTVKMQKIVALQAEQDVLMDKLGQLVQEREEMLLAQKQANRPIPRTERASQVYPEDLAVLLRPRGTKTLTPTTATTKESSAYSSVSLVDEFLPDTRGKGGGKGRSARGVYDDDEDGEDQEMGPEERQARHQLHQLLFAGDSKSPAQANALSSSPSPSHPPPSSSSSARRGSHEEKAPSASEKPRRDLHITVSEEAETGKELLLSEETDYERALVRQLQAVDASLPSLGTSLPGTRPASLRQETQPRSRAGEDGDDDLDDVQGAWAYRQLAKKYAELDQFSKKQARELELYRTKLFTVVEQDAHHSLHALPEINLSYSLYNSHQHRSELLAYPASQQHSYQALYILSALVDNNNAHVQQIEELQREKDKATEEIRKLRSELDVLQRDNVHKEDTIAKLKLLLSQASHTIHYSEEDYHVLQKQVQILTKKMQLLLVENQQLSASRAQRG